MKPCYVFDIDGTLFDCQHRIHFIQKSPKDWRGFFAACLQDSPIPHMVQLAITLFDADKQIVYCSGRSDECRDLTMESLGMHNLPEAPLYMRREGDHRDDDILKSEMLDQMRKDGWEPVMVFEDRSRVVKMWRARGIPCCQVVEGDF